MEMLAGGIAKRAGVNLQTVKFYERRGLLAPARRKDSGYRVYDGESLRRLRFIKQAQGLGFTLNEIRELLSLRVSKSPGQCDKVLRKADRKLVQMRGKISQLTRMASTLEGLILACQRRTPSDTCPILKCCEDAAVERIKNE